MQDWLKKLTCYNLLFTLPIYLNKSAGNETVFEHFGNSSLTAVFLITGDYEQMITWPEAFCKEPVEKVLKVIRFDNRDTGLYTQFHVSPEPDLTVSMAGDFLSVAYTLSDMAADTVGLMDALGFDTENLVGASMVSMIDQAMAIKYPARLKSVTSTIATTGIIS